MPGQEAREWSRLEARLFAREKSPRRVFFGLGMTGTMLALVAVMGWLAMPGHIPLASAQSQAPGIFATTFYSPAAQAQVVWLNGVDPASDQPSYMDPTSVLVGNSSPNGRF